MRIDQLAFIVSLDETKSISQTSRALYISRQHVSKTLQQIEQEMGCDLVVRSQKGVEWTPAGQLMVDFARRTLDDFNHTRNQIYQLAHENTLQGELHICSGVLTTFSILPEMIFAFNERYPNVTLQLYEEEATEVLNRIIHYPQYIGVLPIISNKQFQHIYQPYLDQVNVYPLLEDRYQCLCSVSSPLAKQKSVTLAQFVQYPIALNQRLIKDNSHITRLLNTFGPLNVAFSSHDPYTYQQAICSNRYVGLSSQQASAKNTASPYHKQLTNVPFREDMHFHTCLVTAKQPINHVALDTFCQFAMSYFKR